MKAIFWTRSEEGVVARSDWRETNLAKAIQNGARLCGDEVEIRTVDDLTPEVRDCDLMLGIGVKRRDWFRAYNAAGISYCYFDKGYIRKRAEKEWLLYWRASVNGHQPIGYVRQAKHDRGRADRMSLRLSPWREPRGDLLIVDGSSAKHAYFHAPSNISRKDVHEYADKISRDLVERIRSVSQRSVVFRPKPSYRQAKPIEGTEFARGRGAVHVKDFEYDFDRAHAVITYGSNLCFDAVLHGVPSIVLGHGIAGPISSTSLDDIEDPYLAPERDRQQWLNNVAHSQFKLEEFSSGEGWQVIRDMMASCPISPL